MDQLHPDALPFFCRILMNVVGMIVGVQLINGTDDGRFWYVARLLGLGLVLAMGCLQLRDGIRMGPMTVGMVVLILLVYAFSRLGNLFALFDRQQ